MQNNDYCKVSVATFDKLADQYAAKYFDLRLYDRYLERFAKCIDAPGASVLDVACGPGNVSGYLAKIRPDLKLLGIDLAEGMLRQARLRVPGVEFLQKDCRRIDELGCVFDAAAFAFGLSYLTDSDAEQFLVSLNAALTDSATFYLSTITGESSQSGFEVTGSGDRIYIEYRSVSAVTTMVQRAGYRIEFMDVLQSPDNASKVTQDLILIGKRAERNDP